VRELPLRVADRFLPRVAVFTAATSPVFGILAPPHPWSHLDAFGTARRTPASEVGVLNDRLER
jgi:hypothetical protein